VSTVQETKYKGFKALDNALGRFPHKLQMRIGKAAVRAGASKYTRLVRKGIILGGDENDVHLKRSIGVKALKSRANKKMIMAQVGVSGPAARYAHLYEFGRSGTSYEGQHVFENTLKSSEQQIVEAITSRLMTGMEKETFK